MISHDSRLSLRAKIIRALSANIIPGLVLQVFACLIGLAYFYWPAAQSVFTFFAQLSDAYGPLYAMVSTSLFGGLLPVLLMKLNGKLQHHFAKEVLFYCILWALVGLLINAFYSWQIFLFGDNNDLITVIKKTAFDQFVFSTLLTCPALTIIYLWREQHFSWRRTAKHINKILWLEKIPCTIVTNWMIWIPAVSLIYLMPANLQIPLFNLVLCFFVLLLSIINVDENIN